MHRDAIMPNRLIVFNTINWTSKMLQGNMLAYHSMHFSWTFKTLTCEA